MIMTILADGRHIIIANASRVFLVIPVMHKHACFRIKNIQAIVLCGCPYFTIIVYNNLTDKIA